MDDAGEPQLGRAELGGALASVDPAVRSAALRRAAGDPALEDLVMPALLDPASEVRRAAVAAVGVATSPQVAMELIRVSGGDISAGVRVDAVESIGRILAARLADRSPA